MKAAGIRKPDYRIYSIKRPTSNKRRIRISAHPKEGKANKLPPSKTLLKTEFS